jgi:hypothetical protein
LAVFLVINGFSQLNPHKRVKQKTTRYAGGRQYVIQKFSSFQENIVVQAILSERKRIWQTKQIAYLAQNGCVSTILCLHQSIDEKLSTINTG